MPRNEQTPMDQKTQFLSEFLRDSLSLAELCRRYSISRKTHTTKCSTRLGHTIPRLKPALG